MIYYLDMVATFIGWIVLYLVGFFLVLRIAYPIVMIPLLTFRFWRMMWAAEKEHRNVVKAAYKNSK